MTFEDVPGEVASEEDIPKDHPRYQDLLTRYRIERGIELGITHLQGMHAEGRASAFDYLLGERTIPSASEATRAAVAHLLLAEQPVISVNGNVAALVPEATATLAALTDAAIEVNLFHRSEDRIQRIIDHLQAHGAGEVKGLTAEARLPGLSHDRARVAEDGIFTADVVVVPLEDGDRAQALEAMGKTEIVIDLNPLSRSPQAATVPIIDNIIRAFPNMITEAKALSETPSDQLERITQEFDPEHALEEAERAIRAGLREESG